MKYRNFTRRFLFGSLGILFLYFIVLFIYGWISDWQPGPEPTPLPFDQHATEKILQDSSITLVTWNVGYGGLGAESDFSYDDQGMWYSGSSMVRSPKVLVEKNLNGVLDFFRQNQQNVDFFLIQEADWQSNRSYGIRQYDAYQKVLPGYMADFALNYKCSRVPIPLLEPWNAYGSVLSGLATFSHYEALEATRHQLPGHYPMPDRIFQLDRCAALHRYPTAWGKELIVINLHNAAYDPGDKIKAFQLPYLRDLALAEYAKGNYVILGGDWNQCPPHFRSDTFSPGHATKRKQSNLNPDLFPEDWTFAYDPTVSTNRSAADPYVKGSTFEALIDFFLISPNLQLRTVKGIDQGFQFSDHQPVLVTINLR